MTRSLHQGAFLVVEGDTDARVFRDFIDNTCILIPAEGKDNAVKALEMLEKSGFQGLLVIVDADFWRLEGHKTVSMNLLLTDNHDFDTMILSTPEVMEKVLEEFGCTEKLAKFPGPIINIILENAS
ncbi:MAG: DUF4435 domain-containing protein, partial [Acidobacteria bacterium]|nr:DUF4435 domain-containing protein [Acidobacteriota bacterium]